MEFCNSVKYEKIRRKCLFEEIRKCENVPKCLKTTTTEILTTETTKIQENKTILVINNWSGHVPVKFNTLTGKFIFPFQIFLIFDYFLRIFGETK